MTTETASPLASVSHISLLHRPYGPRMHMDENAAGGSVPESFSSVNEAASFLSSQREKRNNAPVADAGSTSSEDTGDAGDDAGTNHAAGDDNGAADHELSDEGNAAPDENQVPGEGEGSDAEGESLPPVERPRSWSKDDQAEWDSLPRSLQEKLAAREDTRDKAIRKAQNDAAAQAKGLTAREQAAEQARQQFEARAREAHAILIREQQSQFSDIKTMDDVRTMAAQDPLRYLQWQAHQQDLQVTAAAVKEADERAVKAKDDGWKAFRAKEDAAALEHIPDLGDAKKAPAIMRAAVEHLQGLGFTAEELGAYDKGEKLSLFDHRVQRLIFDGMRYQQVTKAATAAKKTPVPPVQRPGTRQPTGNAPSERIQTLTNRLNSSGSLKDAAALLVARRNSRSR